MYLLHEVIVHKIISKVFTIRYRFPVSYIVLILLILSTEIPRIVRLNPLICYSMYSTHIRPFVSNDTSLYFVSSPLFYNSSHHPNIKNDSKGLNRSDLSAWLVSNFGTSTNTLSLSFIRHLSELRTPYWSFSFLGHPWIPPPIFTHLLFSTLGTLGKSSIAENETHFTIPFYTKVATKVLYERNEPILICLSFSSLFLVNPPMTPFSYTTEHGPKVVASTIIHQYKTHINLTSPFLLNGCLTNTLHFLSFFSSSWDSQKKKEKWTHWTRRWEIYLFWL